MHLGVTLCTEWAVVKVEIRAGVYSFGSCMQQHQDTELDTNSHRPLVEGAQLRGTWENFQGGQWQGKALFSILDTRRVSQTWLMQVTFLQQLMSLILTPSARNEDQIRGTTWSSVLFEWPFGSWLDMFENHYSRGLISAAQPRDD